MLDLKLNEVSKNAHDIKFKQGDFLDNHIALLHIKS